MLTMRHWLVQRPWLSALVVSVAFLALAQGVSGVFAQQAWPDTQAMLVACRAYMAQFVGAMSGMMGSMGPDMGSMMGGQMGMMGLR